MNFSSTDKLKWNGAIATFIFGALQNRIGSNYVLLPDVRPLLNMS
jgi:hypothetical protein